jgi:hypothetical protein
MLDYLLAADLLILTVCQALLVYHCFKAGPRAALFAGFITERAEHLSDTLTEYGAILEDIASVLEDRSAGGGAPTGGAPASGLTEMLLTGLMNRVTMGPEHGSQENPVGAVHEAEQPTSTE